MTLQLFKWMMALAVMLYLPLLFEQVKGFRRKDSKHSDEYVKERVESLWFDVTHFYNQLASKIAHQLQQADDSSLQDALPEVWPDFDQLYCSEAWNKCMAEAETDKRKSLQASTAGSQSAPGNYWLGQGLHTPDGEGQDDGQLGFLYINKVEVIDRTGDQATVSLTLHNGNRAVPMLLAMVFERDDWYIDNMTLYWNETPSTRYYDWRQETERLKAEN